MPHPGRQLSSPMLLLSVQTLQLTPVTLSYLGTGPTSGLGRQVLVTSFKSLDPPAVTNWPLETGPSGLAIMLELTLASSAAFIMLQILIPWALSREILSGC